MNGIMMFHTISRIFNSIGSGMRVNNYGALYLTAILVFLVILLVREHLVLLLQLQICLWMLLMRFILMLLRSTVQSNNILIITVSLVLGAYLTPSGIIATITHLAVRYTAVVKTTPLETASNPTPPKTAILTTPSETIA